MIMSQRTMAYLFHGLMFSYGVFFALKFIVFNPNISTEDVVLSMIVLPIAAWYGWILLKRLWRKVR